MRDSAGCILTAFVSLTNIAVVKTDCFFLQKWGKEEKIKQSKAFRIFEAKAYMFLF